MPQNSTDFYRFLVVDVRNSPQNQWLSLGDASKMLQVNEATLRQWGDNGYITVYRTPGGHRRFSKSDVQKLTRQSTPNVNSASKERREDSALRRIRRRLAQDDVSQQSWFQSVQDDGKDRMRVFGSRLLSLLLEEPSQKKRRHDALQESLMVGREYGTEMADRNVPIKDTTEALIFFRSIVLESVEPANSRTWGQILELADHVLIGVVESYQKRIENFPKSGGGSNS